MEGRPLLGHQDEIVTWAVGTLQTGTAVSPDRNRQVPLRGVLIHDDPGLGKTTSALTIVTRLNVFPALIVCPPNCVSTWVEECRNFPQLHVIVFKNGRKIPSVTEHPNTVFVISYKSLENPFKAWVHERATPERYRNDAGFRRRLSVAREMDMDDFRYYYGSRPGQIKGEHTIYNGDMLYDIGDRWVTVVFDEAHAVKDASTKVSKAVCLLPSRFRIALTGTPIMNKVNELCNILRFALQYSEEDGATFVGSDLFRKCKMGRTRDQVREHVQIPKPWDMNVMLELDKNFPLERNWYLQRLQMVEGAVADMRQAVVDNNGDAKRVATRKFFSNTAALRILTLHRDLYVEHREEDGRLVANAQIPAFPVEWSARTHLQFPGWFRHRVMHFFMTMRRAFPFFYRVRDLMRFICTIWAHQESTIVQPSPKLLASYDIYKDMVARDPDDKLVIFSESRAYLERCVVPYFRQRGVGTVLLCGGTVEQKTRTLEAFKNNSKIRVMCVVKSVGGVGLNLQDTSGTCIVSEPGWNEAVDAQCVSRIVRHGQARDPPRIYRLLIANSVDTAMRQLQDMKKLVAKAALIHNQSLKVAEYMTKFLDRNPLTALQPTHKELVMFFGDFDQEEEEDFVGRPKRPREIEEEEEEQVDVLVDGKWMKID